MFLVVNCKPTVLSGLVVLLSRLLLYPKIKPETRTAALHQDGVTLTIIDELVV